MYLKSPYPELPPTPHANVHHLLFHRREQAKWKDYTLHIDAKTEERLTFREFLDHVQLAMTALGASVEEGGLGLGTQEDGEMIGIMSQNSMDYITLVHSLLGLTTPFALIPSYSTPFELRHILNLTKCTRLFVSAQILPLVLPVLEDAGMSSDRIYIIGGTASGRESLSKLIEGARTKNTPTVAARPAVKDTLAYLVLSSGTTGPPKAVMTSHGNIAFSIIQFGVFLQVLAENSSFNDSEGIQTILAFLPLHHVYGLQFYAIRPFIQPCTVVLLGEWDVDVALKLIPQYKITHLTLIPSVIHQLVNHPNIQNFDLSSINQISTGAAYLPQDLALKIPSIVPEGTILAQAYGLSECSAGAIIQPVHGFLGRPHIPGSSGYLAPGMEARVVRTDGSDADADEVGELYIRCGAVTLGYLNNEKATRETFVENGWLRTGDLFKVDKDGNFFFLDRAKDTLKVSGSQVSPVEIEDVLLAHPKKLITDATVAGIKGGRTSDEKIPHAWVVLSKAGKMMGVGAVKRELDTWHKANLSKYKWLRGGIEVVQEIPKSPTGKVLRRVLQDIYEEQAAQTLKGRL